MTAPPPPPSTAPSPSTGADVAIPAPDGAPDPAYANLPAGATRAVVVIHEILGRAPEIDAVVDRFAARGYAAVAPDLFHGRGPVECVRDAITTMADGTGPFVEQVLRARAWLTERTGIATEHIGIIGFCLGGGFALAMGRGWGAVSTNYGDVPSAEVLRGIGPVIGCYGGRDVPFGAMGKTLRKRVPAGTEVELHAYPNVGHAFLTDGHHPVMATLTWPLFHVQYNAAVAAEAWEKIMAFFDRHLA